MRRLYVLYDSRCGLCTWLKSWLQRQKTWIPIRLVDAASEECRTLFPGLNWDGEDLVVVSSQGEVWRNDRAWIMVMFALREYRRWARRLSHPALLPFARHAFMAVSKNRAAVSRQMGLRSEKEIAAE